MKYEISIKKILFHSEEIEIGVKIRKEDHTSFNDRIFILKFNPRKEWSPYYIVLKIGLWMAERIGKDRKVFGKTLRNNILKITDKEFEKQVYYSWMSASYESRIGRRGIFRLFYKRGSQQIEEEDIDLRIAFAKSLFQKEGGKRAEKSWYWLGEYQKTKILFEIEPKYEFESKTQKIFPEEHYNYGKSYLILAHKTSQKKSYKKACESFKTAIKGRKNFAEAYCDLGASLFNLALLENRDELLRESLKNSCLAIKYNKKIPFAFHNIGLVLSHYADKYNRLSLYDLAEKNFELSIKCDENFALSYFNWGVVLDRLFFLKNEKHILFKAEEKFLSAIEIKNDYADAYMNLGVVYFKIGEQTDEKEFFYKALTNQKKAVKYDDTAPEKYYNLGITMIKISEFDNSVVNENIIDTLFRGFLLAIIKQNWNFALHIYVSKLGDLANQLKNKKLINILSSFFKGINIILGLEKNRAMILNRIHDIKAKKYDEVITLSADTLINFLN